MWNKKNPKLGETICKDPDWINKEIQKIKSKPMNIPETKPAVLHTKGEWAINHGQTYQNRTGGGFVYMIESILGKIHDVGTIICSVHGKTKEEAEANAQRIVTAVNMRDELVAALNYLKIYVNASLVAYPYTGESALEVIENLLEKAKQR